MNAKLLLSIDLCVSVSTETMDERVILLVVLSIAIWQKTLASDESIHPADEFNVGRAHFPYKASLQTFRFQHFCTAVIVNDRWFLTAAHCVVRVQNARNFMIVVRQNGQQPRGSSISRIVIHPNFSPQHRQNDVALIRAVAKIRLSAVVRPVVLPTGDLGDQSNIPFYVGFGRTRVSCLCSLFISSNS